MRREAALAHPCAPRHLHIRVQCAFGRPKGGPEGRCKPAAGAGHTDVPRNLSRRAINKKAPLRGLLSFA